MGHWIKGLSFPPSANALFIYRSKFKRIKTPAYRSFERDTALRMINQRISLEEKPHAFYAFFYAEKSFWFTKSSGAQRRDLDNRIKGILDSICKNIEFDDKWIFEIHAFKCIGQKRVDVYFTENLKDKIQTEE